jgi:carbon-monoxide dehydrogenase iron sulfur subunit
MMGKKASRMLYVDIGRCLACKSCELACAVEHSASKELYVAVREEPRPASRVKVEAAAESAVPLQCRHCEDAPCVAICPTKAIEKLGTGLPVLIREERCIGCKFCVMVCPFGVITLRKDGKVALKCDLCLERQEMGEEPACVAACHTGALECLTVEEITARKRHTAAEALVEAEKKSLKAVRESV